MLELIIAVVGIVGGIIVLVGLGFGLVFAGYFLKCIEARAAGVHISPLQLFGMRLRKLDGDMLVQNMIRLHNAGVRIPMSDFEAHVMAGGSLDAVVDAAITADKAGLPMDFPRLCAIDLAGRDITKAIAACVKPVIIDCPPRGSEPVTGVARDGIRLSARVRITVRANLERLVGGAGEQTVIARVGEGIVSAIGHADSHQRVLESPDLISKHILDRGLDAGTAYEILSIDVGDINVVDNVRARLVSTQADSDTQVAQARAEMRRVAAVAREREMRAKVTEMNAQVTANRADIPLAMANAARAGHIWRSPRPVRAVTARLLWDSAAN